MLRRSYRRHLIVEEVLVKCTHEHWRKVTLPLLCTLVVLAAILFTAFTALTGSGWWIVCAILAVIGLIAWCWLALPGLARWYAVSYAVTSKRVLFREGVFHRHYHQIDLVAVTNPTLDRSGWDLVFRTGTLNLGGGQSMKRIPRAVRIEQLISQLAANQTKNVMELSHILRTMGYTKLTKK